MWGLRAEYWPPPTLGGVLPASFRGVFPILDPRSPKDRKTRSDLVMLIRRCRHRLTTIVADIRHVLCGCFWARPALAMHAAGTGGDLLRGRAQLLAENALLRQQL